MVAVLLLHGGSAEPRARLTIYTEVDPPYNYVDSAGRPEGIFVDLVREIQRRCGNEAAIQVVPWSRGYRAVQEETNVILFSMARTPEREHLVHWIGPVLENRWILFARSDSPLAIRNLDDARRLPAIGSVRDFAWDQYLEGLGFTNLERVSENSLNLHKVANGRIPAFVGADLTLPSVAVRCGYRPSNFKPVLVFRAIPLYIALSGKSRPELAEAWNRHLAAIKGEGLLERILARHAGD
ncbi:MAG: transporter substrate-binding domain-containing protein [Spirochaetes bacterium]|nr:transporter substrate-binding domain-containing protein [Spirochaetota bacterium]